MEIKDNLVDLLIKILNNLDTNANRKIKKELAESTNYTRDKNKLLLRIAKAVLESPEAKTCDLIYPIADEQKLKNLINELENKSDTVLNRKNYNNMRSSYQRHYRRILPDIISALNFNSNNDKYKPIIEAIKIINTYLDSKSRYYSKNEIVSLYGMRTNMGLKAVSPKGLDENYMDLEYIKRKFINKDNLRAAIAEVVNATLDVAQEHYVKCFKNMALM